MAETMPVPTEDRDHMIDSSISTDDDYENISPDEVPMQGSTASSAIIVPSHVSDVDAQSEAAMTGSTVSIIEQSDAEPLSEGEVDATDATTQLTMPSMEIEHPRLDVETPKEAPRLWQGAHHINSRFAEDMKDSEVTVRPGSEHTESITSKTSTEAKQMPSKFEGAAKGRSQIHATVQRFYDDYIRRHLGYIYVMGSLLVVLLGLTLPTKLEPLSEMLERQQQLQIALDDRHIMTSNSHILDAKAILTYPLVHKLASNGVDVVGADYFFPDSISVVPFTLDQLLIFLPRDASGSEYPHEPAVGLRTASSAIRVLQQADLIPGVTYVKIQADDLDDFYFVDVRSGKRASTTQIFLDEDEKRQLRDQLKRKSEPGSGDGSTDHKDKESPITNLWDDLLAAQKQLLDQTLHKVAETKAMLSDDLTLASRHLNEQVGMANARGKKLLETASAAFTTQYDEALKDISDMGETLYHSTSEAIKAANEIVGNDIKKVVATTQDNLQQVLSRARRNGKGILERATKNVKSKRLTKHAAKKLARHQRRAARKACHDH